MAEQIAQCPKCMTSFKVTPAQLQMAGGRVRCGYCRHVFDAAKYFVEAQGHALDFSQDEMPAAAEEALNIADPELNLAFDDNGVVVDAQLTESLSVGAVQEGARKPEKETALAFLAATQELDDDSNDSGLDDALDIGGSSISPEQRFSQRPIVEETPQVVPKEEEPLAEDLGDADSLLADEFSIGDTASTALDDSFALDDSHDLGEELAEFSAVDESSTPELPESSLDLAESSSGLIGDPLDLAESTSARAEEFELADSAQPVQEDVSLEQSLDELDLALSTDGDEPALVLDESDDTLSEEFLTLDIAEDSQGVEINLSEDSVEQVQEPVSAPADDVLAELLQPEPATTADESSSQDFDVAADIAEPVFASAAAEEPEEPSAASSHDDEESSRVIEELLGEVEPLTQPQAEPALRRISDPVPEFEQLATDLEFEDVEAAATASQGGMPWSGIAASVALLVLFAAQYIAFNFNELARNTSARPTLEAICGVAGCTVPPYSDIGKIMSEQLTVRTHPERDGALVVDVIVTNSADLPQPFPALQLTFFDIRSEPVATRKFYPGEYLHGEMRGLTSMPNKNPVHLALEVMDPGAQAINYELKLVQLP
jgi:predicted Zn finger-like uncharacterized protein